MHAVDAIADTSSQTMGADPTANTCRLPRLVYYLGMALLAELIFRVGGLTFSDIVFFVALLLLLASVRSVRSEGVRSLQPTLVYAVMLFGVAGVFASLSSPHALSSLETVARFAYLTLVWFWLGTVVLRTPTQVVTAVTLWITSVAINGLAALVQLFFPNLFPVPFGGRFTGFTGHPNDLGGVTAIAFVPAMMIATRRGPKLIERIPSVALLACIAIGLILSGSVGALLAAGAGVTFWLVAVLLRNRNFSAIRKRYLALTLIGAGTVGLWLVSQPTSGAYSPTSRIASVTGRTNQESTLQSRFDIDQLAIRTMPEHLLLGRGLDDATATDEFGDLVHNMLLGVWFGGGSAAALGVLLILLSLCQTSRVALRQARSTGERVLALALIASLLSFLVYGLSAPVLYVRYGWVPAALLIALRASQQRVIHIMESEAS